MKAGWLRHSITIQQKSGSSRSAIGEDVPAWATLATVWASIEPIRGSEGVALRTEGSEITTKIRTWYVAGVTPAMRVVHGSVVYNILEAYSPLEKGVELEMLCSREAS